MEDDNRIGVIAEAILWLIGIGCVACMLFSCSGSKQIEYRTEYKPIVVHDSTTIVREVKDSVSDWVDITDEMSAMYGVLDSAARYYGRTRVKEIVRMETKVVQDTAALNMVAQSAVMWEDRYNAALTEHKRELDALRKELTPTRWQRFCMDFGKISIGVILAVIVKYIIVFIARVRKKI